MKISKPLIFVFLLFGQLVFSQEEEKIEFLPNGKVLVELFGDYFYKLGGDTILKGDGEFQKKHKEDNAFIFRRLFFGYEYNFSPKLYAKIVLEGSDALKIEEKRGVYIKYAYLEWKDIFPGSKLTIGGQPTSLWSLAEKTWGLRYVEKTVADMRKFGAANDFGIGLSGNFDNNEVFGYHMFIANGTSEKVEIDKYKKLYGTLTAKLLDKNLLIALHANYEPTGNKNSKMHINGFVGYTHKLFSMGAELHKFGTTIADTTTKQIAISGFINAMIIKNKLNVFARMDSYNPNLDLTSKGYGELFSTFGFEYSPVKNISFIPNLWFINYKAKGNTVERNADVVARFTFRFKI